MTGRGAGAYLSTQGSGPPPRPLLSIPPAPFHFLDINRGVKMALPASASPQAADGYLEAGVQSQTANRILPYRPAAQISDLTRAGLARKAACHFPASEAIGLPRPSWLLLRSTSLELRLTGCSHVAQGEGSEL